MQPHPDFADVTLPRSVQLASCEMTPLSPAFTQEDYDVVMEAADLLSDGPGDWPDGLTLEENAIDLAWHEREFTAKRSFSWILRDGTGGYLGCFYIYPALGARGSAQAVLWVRRRADREALARTIRADLETWASNALPAGISLDWTCKPPV
ncbi:MAG: hypothetical protein AAGI03_00970 [Pseudomonadota bacterium]